MVAAQEALRDKHSGCYCFVILKRINESETSILEGIVTRTLRVDIFSGGRIIMLRKLVLSRREKYQSSESLSRDGCSC